MFEIHEKPALEFLRYYVGIEYPYGNENIIFDNVFKDHQDLYNKIMDYKKYKRKIDDIYKFYNKKQDENERNQRLIELSKEYPNFIGV